MCGLLVSTVCTVFTLSSVAVCTRRIDGAAKFTLEGRRTGHIVTPPPLQSSGRPSRQGRPRILSPNATSAEQKIQIFIE
jgi:hypothetical protein